MAFLVDGLAISIVSGLFTAAWGAFKDAPYEGFNPRSFWRSVAFSIAIFAIVAMILHGEVTRLYAFQLFFLVMGLERIAIEIYKPCFRREDQSKYLIPQDGTFLGVHVDADGVRYAIGLALICGTLGVLSLATTIASLPAHFAVAVTTGLFICCGGAGKDAPFEGFQRRKFLRSAIVLAVASPLLYLLGPVPLGLAIFIAGGVERLIVESYKTYFTSTPPGKFRRDLPVIDHRFVARREPLRFVAFAIVMLVSSLYACAVAARFA
jgi:hypothetical protein